MSLLLSRSLLSAELLKVRKRWLPFILLALLVLLVGMQVWLGGYVSWRESDDFSMEEDSLQAFILPWSLEGILDTIQYWGAIMTGIVAASVVATEHGWGTVRQAVLRGQSRNSYLTTKLAGIGVLGVAAFVIALAFGVVSSLLATAIAGETLPGGPSFFDVLLMVGRSLYAMAPYVLLAFCLTVVSRSTTLGVGGILVYVIVELTVLGILGAIGGNVDDYRPLFLGYNVAGLMSANRLNGDEPDSITFRDDGSTFDLPDPPVAALVIAIYCAIFIATSYYVFNRRDLGR